MAKTKAESQVVKFRNAARALEADEDEAKFDAALKRVAKAPPPAEAEAKGKKESR